MNILIDNRFYRLKYWKKTSTGASIVTLDFEKKSELLTFLHQINSNDILSVQQIRNYSIVKGEN